MPHNVFSKLYDVVWPVIAYDPAIWGEKSYSCLDAVQNRATKFFLRVGRFMPNNAVTGDMKWVPTNARQRNCIIDNSIVRISNMDNDRLNNHIDTGISKKAVNDLINDFKLTWLENINKDVKNNGRSSNKLRKYKLLKQVYCTEAYCLSCIEQRLLSLELEWHLNSRDGGYEGLTLDSCLCPFCVT
jgi:hypothetical protein